MCKCFQATTTKCTTEA
uniref:Uncharacterized protein n=1 Tax=Anopheles dirus TaxID=7168 RepID=A0A182NY20_9DIPT